MPRYCYICSQYSAPYTGNFIPSLEMLAAAMQSSKGMNCIYLFPKSAANTPWMPDFMKKNKVELTDDNPHSPQVQRQLEALFSLRHPSVIYTHFDGYDTCAVRAAKHYPLCKIVWHLHNHLGYMSHPVKKCYQLLCFLRHYGYFSRRNVYAIAVSHGVRDFVCRHGFPKDRIQTIPNGIDTSRITPVAYSPKEPFVFLAYGGRNVQKRVDVLCHALPFLKAKKPYEVWITKGTDTESVITNIGRGAHLRLIPQTADIDSLLSQASCFVSCSAYETFSYAVAEAAYKGLPVIQSRIEGTQWNEANPGTLTFMNLDSKDLALKMQEIMDKSHEELAEMGNCSTAYITANYTLDTWTSKILRFLTTHHIV